MSTSTSSCIIDSALQKEFAPRLIEWQKKHGRHDLPWQGTQNAYKVWLSEVMLQQTQVVTVVEYYQRFLTKFPTVKKLAAAHVDEVLSLWSGLGYYSRARNLHRCAQVVQQEHSGNFPQTTLELMKLPGIGRTTAAAIAAFCFNERTSILDGNVKRVLTRVLAYDKDISKSATDKELWEIAQQLLPTTNYIKQYGDEAITWMGRYTQGLMDLGATLCQPRKAECERCPMQSLCQAHAKKRELEFPYKARKIKRSTQAGYLLWLTSPLGVWLIQRPNKGIWGGLYSFPLFEESQKRDSIANTLESLERVELLPFKHVLTHIDWILQAVHIKLDKQQADILPIGLKELKGHWYSIEEALTMGLPAPIRVMLEEGATE